MRPIRFPGKTYGKVPTFVHDFINHIYRRLHYTGKGPEVQAPYLLFYHQPLLVALRLRLHLFALVDGGAAAMVETGLDDALGVAGDELRLVQRVDVYKRQRECTSSFW